MAEDRGFEVVDRRRARLEPEPPGESAPAAESTQPAVGAEDAPGFGSPLPEITVGGLLQWALGLFQEKAWVGMGLIPDPMSGKMNRNLEDGRRAIDVVADLVKHLEPDCSPAEKRELETLVRDLRINYVRQAERSNAVLT